MRIVGDLTTPMNSRFNRAMWLTPPFDLSTFVGARLSLAGTRVGSLPLYASPKGRYVSYVAEVDSLLVAAPTGDFLEIFSTWSPTNDSSVYNTNCWAASLDFTGVSWWPYGHTNGGGLTCISPRHAVSSWHGGTTPAVDDDITWIAADGTRVTRTVRGRQRVLDSSGSGIDIGVTYYNGNLPTHYKVLPVGWADLLDAIPTSATLNPMEGVIATRPPMITLNRNRLAMVHEGWITDHLTIKSVTHNPGTPPLDWRYTMSGYRNLYDNDTATEGGDSGKPIFILLSGELVLLGCHSSATIAKHVGGYGEQVNTAMAELEAASGGTDDYQLTEWEPTKLLELAGTDNSNQVLVGT